ncbi:enoyl-(acyl carrier protein) reductase [Salinisphaera sp. PC39]|uniref:SDR family oxidoreductase n=1 Tax=Salinisphaera sp. PC39 TaxID=1304156 RepID=UPI003341877E
MSILVTGGTKGIGFAIAKAFAEPGNRVYVNYAGDEAAAERAVAEIEAAGAEARAVRADVGTPAGCRELMDAIAADGGRIDQLVHCAVRPYPTPVLEADPETFAAALSVNGTALLYLVQAALPLMDRGSSVFFLSSRGGRVVVPNYAAIGAGKALAESLMRYLAVELAPRGIRINAVAPALVATDAVRTIFGDKADELAEKAARENPTGRGIEAADYTNLIRWLASDEAAYIQGQVIYVNGGANLMA